MTIYPWATPIRIALVSLALFSANAVTAQKCSNETTVGRYVVVGDGYLSPGPNAPLVPAKLLSIVTADENGVYAGSGTINIGGQVFSQEVIGTQQLNSDCTGLISYKQKINGQPAPNLNFKFVVSKHGDRIDGLGVDPGGVFSAVLRRLERSRPAESKDVKILPESGLFKSKTNLTPSATRVLFPTLNPLPSRLQTRGN